MIDLNSLPEDFQVMSSESFGPGAPLVYYVVAAVGDVGFEKALIEPLRQLLAITSISSICTEAGVGDNSLWSLARHRTASEREHLGMKYVESGVLKGCEYLTLTSDRRLELWGVEDPDLYTRCVGSLSEAASRRAAWGPVFSLLRADLDTLAKRDLTGDLRRYLVEIADCGEDFVAQIDLLKRHALELGIELNALNLSPLSLAMELMAGKPALQRILGLFEEIELVRSTIAARLAKTDTDCRYVRLWTQLPLLERLLTLTTQSGEVAYLQSVEEAVSHESVLRDVSLLIGPSAPSVVAWAEKSADFAHSFEHSMRFYTLMHRRAGVMAQKTLNRMRETNVESCVLITTGFHRDTVTTWFKQFRVSHAVIVPKWTATPGPDDKYFELMTDAGQAYRTDSP